MNRRTFLGMASIFAAGTIVTVSIPYFKNHEPELGPNSIDSKVSEEDALKAFNELKTSDKARLISELEDFVLTETNIGREATRVFQSSPANEVIDNLIPEGHVVYSPYTNTVRLAPISDDLNFRTYLVGKPMLFGRANAHVKAIQDHNSRWNQFESFVSDFIPETNAGTLNISFPVEKASEYAQRFMSQPGATYDQALTAFLKEWTDYTKQRAERKVIYELQASMSFEPELQESSNPHFFSSSVNSDILLVITYATTELMGILPPLEAAIFVGKIGNDSSEYVLEVNRLIQERRVGDAYKLGMGRRDVLRTELELIKDKALLLAVKYASSKD